MLITDYSSTMCDAMLANKPVIIYANDIEDYNDERGNIFSFQELPFSVAKDNKELFGIIDKNDIKEVERKYNKFEEERIKFYKMGQASKNVAKIIRDKASTIE